MHLRRHRINPLDEAPDRFGQLVVLPQQRLDTLRQRCVLFVHVNKERRLVLHLLLTLSVDQMQFLAMLSVGDAVALVVVRSARPREQDQRGRTGGLCSLFARSSSAREEGGAFWDNPVAWADASAVAWEEAVPKTGAAGNRPAALGALVALLAVALAVVAL